MHAVEWKEGKVRFLDQTALPGREVWISTDDPAAVMEAIRRLAIRGAPLIGIAGAYAIALAARSYSTLSPDDRFLRLAASVDAVAQLRPTAVNLRWAAARMSTVAGRARTGSSAEFLGALDEAAEAIRQEDEAACEAISRNGLSLIRPNCCLLTHCNTGSLATGGRGTALGIATLAWEKGLVREVIVDETRPLLQGSRLTAWELDRAGIPYRLITDSTAGALMAGGGIDAVVVGADRIAANGDTANKIGTYGLAVLARAHDVPFYVAAPVSTLDRSMRSGSGIPIEERGPEEITSVGGISVAPEGARAYAPAFDVTPSRLITAIITDRGVARPPFDGPLQEWAGTSDRDPGTIEAP